jgi:hypothetical protein
MGRLIDRLLQEAQEDNRKTVRELVSNKMDGNQPSRRGMANLMADLRADESRDHMRAARELIKANPDVLSRVGLDAVHVLCTEIPGLGVSEARHVLSEFMPKPEQESVTGPDDYGPFERSRR